MPLLRDPNQTILADLNAFGNGLLHRYNTLLQADLDPQLRTILQRVLNTRQPLIDMLADYEKARGDQPKAADQEINDLRAMADRLLGFQFGPQAVVGRIIQSEKLWGEHLHEAKELNWLQHEEKLLAKLQAETDAVLVQLARFAEPDGEV
jgi:hypothetical protein